MMGERGAKIEDREPRFFDPRSSILDPRTFPSTTDYYQLSPGGIHLEQHLAEFDGLLVFHQNLGDDAAAIRGDFVKDLHRFNDANDRGRSDFRADAHERLGIGAGGGVKGAGRGTLDGEQFFGRWSLLRGSRNWSGRDRWQGRHGQW